MKTAVEYLLREMEIIDTQKSIGHITLGEYINKRQTLIKQAKEMEKQYFNDCFEEAHQAGRFEGKGIAEKDWITFELWYNETFKSE